MILETIASVLSSMPPIYRKIALYIMENHQSVGFQSIYSLSEKIGVSTASIVRFTKSLGFDGYADLKKALQSELRQQLGKGPRLDSAEIEPLPRALQFKVLLENEEINMKNTVAGLDLETMNSMIDWILEAGKIYTCGFGFSAYIMELFAFSLTCILPKEVINLKGSVVDYSCRFNTCSTRDIVFAADFPPYSGEVVHVATHARGKGARMILFTDSPRCPAFPFAGTIVRCESNSLVMANSYIGLVASIQILLNMLFLREKDSIATHVLTALEIAKAGYELAGLEERSDS